MNKKVLVYALIRYLLLVVLGIGNLWIFYKLFTPLTIYSVKGLLSFFSQSYILNGNIIYFKGVYAEIIEACVAGSAYYLLLILNLSTPMDINKRIKDLLFLFGCFLAINVLRIIAFTLLFYYNFNYFDITHELTWYFGSTLIVIGLWFTGVYLFRIKEIPVYSDFKMIKRFIKSG